MENIIEKFENCTDPEEYARLMFENTDKATGILCFHGIQHEDDENEVYRFHMNWDQNDLDMLIKEHKSLTKSLKILAEMTPEPTDENVNDILKDKNLLNVWDTYLRNFTGKGLYNTEDMAELRYRYEDIKRVNRIRKKIEKHEEIDDNEKQLFEECKGLALTIEEKENLDKYWNARISDAEERIGKSPFAYNAFIFAKRLYRLMELEAPEIIIKNETIQLMIAMALHKFCDRQE